MFHSKPQTTPERAQAIDTEALFRRLLRDYQQPLYWHIRHVVGSHEDAEDALQETFIRVYRNIDTLRNALSERAWLYRIATNEALRIAKEAKPMLAYDPLDEPEAPPMPDFDDIQQALAAAIESLPPKQRAVFSMRYYDNLSYDDIARACDSNVKAVTSNYHVAKEKIREFILSL